MKMMCRWFEITSCLVVLLALAASEAGAGVAPQVGPAASLTTDGQTYNYSIEKFFDPETKKEGYLATAPEISNDQFQLQPFDVVLFPDPSVVFAFGVVDVGAPSSFSFSYTTPLVPVVDFPFTIEASFSSSGTQNSSGGLYEVLPAATSFGVKMMKVILIDSVGGTELTVFDFVDGFSGTVPPNDSFFGPSGDVGPIDGPAGSWDGLRVDIDFTLNGGSRAFSANGIATIEPKFDPNAVPEPTTVLMAGMGLIAIVGLKARHRRSAA